MSRPDEGLIHTWLDGEATAEEAARIEHLIATDPEWAAAVAEARGLVAASSRIVQALDAVPRAVPAATPGVPRAPRRAVPRWMGLAAGLVLVAGTAYVMRGTINDPFTPQPTVETTAASVPPPAAAPSDAPAPRDVSAPPSPVSAPTSLSGAAGAGPASGPASGLATGDATGVSARPERAQPVEERSLDVAAAPMTTRTMPAERAAPAAPPDAPVAAPAAAPAVGALAREDVARRDADLARREAESRVAAQRAPMQRVPEVSNKAAAGDTPERILDPPSSAAIISGRLLGCVTITAPDSLRGLGRAFTIKRAVGDSLEVAFQLRGERIATVRRVETLLTGGITGTLVPCP